MFLLRAGTRRTCMDVCRYVGVYVCLYVHIYVCMCACMYACMYMCDELGRQAWCSSYILRPELCDLHSFFSVSLLLHSRRTDGCFETGRAVCHPVLPLQSFFIQCVTLAALATDGRLLRNWPCSLSPGIALAVFPHSVSLLLQSRRTES